MIENDTVRLLRECDAGIRMGVDYINEVIDKVQGDSLRDLLIRCREEHESLGDEVRGLLKDYHDRGKKPNPVPIEDQVINQGAVGYVQSRLQGGCGVEDIIDGGSAHNTPALNG